MAGESSRLIAQEEGDDRYGMASRASEHEMSLARLCERCLRFDLQSFSRSKVRRRGYLFQHIKNGAARGCELCLVFLHSVKDIKPPGFPYISLFGYKAMVTNPELYVHITLPKEHGAETHQQGVGGLGASRLIIELGDRLNETKTRSRCELYLTADYASYSARSGDVMGRYLGHDPTSDSHFDTIRAWIDHCKTHPRCKRTISGAQEIDARLAPLPSRCIEVLDDGNSLTLRETSGMYDTFIALTHRWHRATERSKTTMENYSSRLHGQGFENLPQLFQDLLIIAAKLNVRFVWIDSLCIIQAGDNGDDWRKEAPKMAHYYQFSLLTVAGTMQDTERGLLKPYSSEHTPWGSNKLIQVPYRDASTSHAGHFYIYQRKERLIDGYRKAIRNSDLFHRGWVLQEWILSKRILYYTSDGLFFECNTDGPRTEYQEKLDFQNVESLQQPHLRLKRSLDVTNKRIIDSWYEIIERYSACQLKKPNEDRILALTGMSHEIGLILSRREEIALSNVGPHYVMAFLSGLWLCDIHHGLLWEENQASQIESTEMLRMTDSSSWSWSSLLVQVKWPKRQPGTLQGLKVIGICFRNRDSEHNDLDYVFSNNLLIPRIHTNGPEHDDGNDPRLSPDSTNISACLHIRGKLCIVHIRGYLRTFERLAHASAFTHSVYSTTPASFRLRAICSPADPDVIAGWGSFEGLPIQDGCADWGYAVYALHVSTEYYRRTGTGTAFSVPVLNVIFVTQVSEQNQIYKRVGVGRIAELNLVQSFYTIEMQDLKLL